MTSPVPPAPCMRRTAVLFGDSITQLGYGEDGAAGWVSLLAHAFSRKADLLNRGFSGYNVRIAEPIAREVFAGALAGAGGRPLLFSTVFFGANDAASPLGHPVERDKPIQHVPVEEFERRLGVIIAEARAVTDGAVLVLSPSPVDRLRWPDRCNAKAREYGLAAQRAAERAAASALPGPGCPVVFVDTFAPIVVGAGGLAGGPEAAGETSDDAPLPAWVALLSDGLHLAAGGNAAVAAAVLKHLPPQCLPDAQPLDFPIWRDVPRGAEADDAATLAALSPAALAKLRSEPAPLRR